MYQKRRGTITQTTTAKTTPQPINKAKYKPGDLPAMEDVLPDCYEQLAKIREILEKHYKDMQDIEFTIEDGRLWMLQTRTGKRTGTATIRMAVEMARATSTGFTAPL